MRLAGIPFNEQDLERDFGRLSKFLLTAEHEYFLYRDFQSRNVMLRDQQTFFVDYQGGRKGALQYDVASLLYDAKADLPPAVRQQLLDYYLDRLGGFADIAREAFMHYYYAYVYVRLMQALGGVTVIGPVIDGLTKPMQIVQMGATVSDLVNHAALAAYGALSRKAK